ncbi:Holliday junction resolvase RuvX [Mycetocola zhujimingii]|uniref:Putative pre-16S rRNA nuclease n=1 Tax=Mycetocola zhujimingii TaxID=2079792 RepID=A0A2U1TGI9_9MICO|nr:Holliday junction resolvase RuvX [Mycetocola zhujimingii]AWB86459.1 Holliday junction resolvase RuvX [Mycetocola zhujimingii]PWC08007.1 Holliday junction resolvase RuvX [Mycetocola zhujimingii]
MRTGVRLGIDVGKVRIGVARSDFHGMLATPIETVQRSTDSGEDVKRIIAIADELNPIELVVGLPLALSGSHTASTNDAVAFAGKLATASAVPVRLVDERLSTVSAHSALRTSGKKSSRSRNIVDQVAAVIILQHALDAERGSSHPPGSLVNPSEGS